MPDEPPPSSPRGGPYRTVGEAAIRAKRPDQFQNSEALRDDLRTLRANVVAGHLDDRGTRELTTLIGDFVEARDGLRDRAGSRWRGFAGVACVLVALIVVIAFKPMGAGGWVMQAVALVDAAVAALTAAIYRRWFNLAAEYDAVIADLWRYAESRRTEGGADGRTLPSASQVALSVAIGSLPAAVSQPPPARRDDAGAWVRGDPSLDREGRSHPSPTQDARVRGDDAADAQQNLSAKKRGEW